MKQLINKINDWYHNNFSAFYLLDIKFTYYAGFSIELCTISTSKFTASLFDLTINSNAICGYLFYKEFYLIRFRKDK